MSEHDALVVLNAIAGVGPATIKALAEFFGSAAEALAHDEGALIASGIVKPQEARNIVHFLKDKF